MKKYYFCSAAIYVTCTPKSKAAVCAIDSVLSDVRSKRDSGAPPLLIGAHYKGASKLGHGIDYLYPHDFGGFVKHQYLPNSHKNEVYYSPTNNGIEAKIKKD